MRRFSVALLIVFLTSSAPAFCKSKSDSDKDEDKKHQLVDQIIEAVEAENKLSEAEIDELKKKQKARLDRIIDVIADKSKMSDEDKAKLKEKICEKKEQHHSLPPELKEKLEKRFDFKSFSKQTTYQVLADHFDDSDLKAILKFLKSSTGQKLFQEGPDMIGQVVELSAERYIPVLMDLSKELKLLHGISPNFPPLPSPKDNDPEHRREMLEKWKQFFKDKLPQPAPAGQGKDET